jgi:TRAP-type C4-dicarboxylate transport system substrate-binding protein
MGDARWVRRAVAAALIGAGLCSCVGACKAGGDRALGGLPVKAVTLKVINTREDADIAAFVNQVRRESDQLITLKVQEPWEAGLPTAEVDAIAAVRAGRADIALIPTRAFDDVQLHAFDALMAPMTIDSVAFETAVLEQPAIRDAMLSSLRSIGLVGLTILPGGLRQPAGLPAPLVTPSDYRGRKIAISPSQIASLAMTTLGATPSPEPFLSLPINGEDGSDLGTGVGAYDQNGASLTTNVVLWPRPLAVVANPKAFARLSTADQRILRRAGADAISPAEKVAADDAVESVGNLCRNGRTTFITATDAEILALRNALEPVISLLRRDPETTRYLDEIKAMAPAYGAAEATETPKCADTSGQFVFSSQRGLLDGTYTVDTTEADLRGTGEDLPGNWGHSVWILSRGHYVTTLDSPQGCGWSYGVFALKGHLVRLIVRDGGASPSLAMNKNRPNEQFTFQWSLFKGRLTLTAGPFPSVSPHAVMVNPWQQRTRSVGASRLSLDCAPPAAGIPPA